MPARLKIQNPSKELLAISDPDRLPNQLRCRLAFNRDIVVAVPEPTQEELEEWDREIDRRLADFERRRASEDQRAVESNTNTSQTSTRELQGRTYHFRCRDIGIICDFEVIDTDRAAVLSRIGNHTEEWHGLAVSSDDVVERIIPKFHWILFLSLLTAGVIVVTNSAPSSGGWTAIEQFLSGASFCCAILYFINWHFQSGDRAIVWFNRFYSIAWTLPVTMTIVLTLTTFEQPLQFSWLSVVVLALGLPSLVQHCYVWQESRIRAKSSRLARIFILSAGVQASLVAYAHIGSLLGGTSNFFEVEFLRQTFFLFRGALALWFIWVAHQAWHRMRISIQATEKIVILAIINLVSIIWIHETTDFLRNSELIFWQFVATYTVIPLWLLQSLALTEYPESKFIYQTMSGAAFLSVGAWWLHLFSGLSAMAVQSVEFAIFSLVVSVLGAAASVFGIIREYRRTTRTDTGP